MATTLIGTLRPHAKGVHVQDNAYNIMDVVTSADGSMAYMAVQDVPAGTALDNAAYWCIYTDVSAVKTEMEAAAERADASAASANEAILNLTDYTSEYALRVRGEIAESAGNPVTIAPDEGSLMRPVTVFSPKQSGSGDPSPGNVRPISGYDALGLNHCGKNLFDKNWLLSLPRTTAENEAFTIRIDQLNANYASGFPAKFKANTQYTLSFRGYISNAGNDPYLCFAHTDGSIVRAMVTNTIENEYVISSTPGKTVKTLLGTFANNGSGTMTLKNVQLEEGSSASAFSSYPDTYSIQIGQTIYGGRMDWGAGVLTVHMVKIPLASLGWSGLDERNRRAAEVAGIVDQTDMEAMPQLVCDMYPTVISNLMYNNTSLIGITQNRKHIMIRTADNAAPASGEVVYRLATPTTIQLTPHQILALKGNNTLYGDGDTIETLWVKPLETSIKERTEPLIERIAALEKAILNG